MTGPFKKTDRSPAALEVLGEATRAGVTNESFGEWMRLATLYQRQGNTTEAARCAGRAIEIHETWGSRHETYSAGPRSLAKARSFLDNVAEA